MASVIGEIAINLEDPDSEKTLNVVGQNARDEFARKLKNASIERGLNSRWVDTGTAGQGRYPAREGRQFSSVSPIERLRDLGKLPVVDQAETETKLTAIARRENQACFEAAERLRCHLDGCMVGVQA